MSGTNKTASAATQNDRKAELESGKEAVAEAYSKLLEAKDHFRQAAEAAGLDWKQDAEAKLAQGKSKAEELCGQANSYLRDKPPLLTLGIAFAAGLLIAQLTSRK